MNEGRRPVPVASDVNVVHETRNVSRVIRQGTGPEGPAGPAGTNGENGLGFTPRGAWSGAESYVARDVVCHRSADGGTGHAYICIQANTNVAPNAVSGPTYWALFTERGEQGDQGPGGDNFTSPVGTTWNPRGAWVSGRAYAQYDVVTIGGSTYLCDVAHTSSSTTKPGVGDDWETKWTKYVSKGNTGPQGPAGAAYSGPPPADGKDGTNGQDGQDAISWISGEVNANGTIHIPIKKACKLNFSNFQVLGGGTPSATCKKNGAGADLTTETTFAAGDHVAVTFAGVTTWATIAIEFA